MIGTARLAHVAIIVGDLDAPRSLPLQVLGLAQRRREELPSEHVCVSFVPAGSADIELVRPTDDAGPLRRFLATRGEAVHHIALRVPDLLRAISMAESAGLRLAGHGARAGAHGTSVAFVHPASLHGVLIEFVENGGTR